jgi:hypothetical protein
LTDEELESVIEKFQGGMEKYFDENPNGPELSLGTEAFFCLRLIQEAKQDFLIGESVSPTSVSPLPELI